MIENDGYALKVFQEECCGNCSEKNEHPEPPEPESIQEYIDRLKSTVSSFSQHDSLYDEISGE